MTLLIFVLAVIIYLAIAAVYARWQARVWVSQFSWVDEVETEDVWMLTVFALIWPVSLWSFLVPWARQRAERAGPSSLTTRLKNYMNGGLR